MGLLEKLKGGLETAGTETEDLGTLTDVIKAIKAWRASSGATTSSGTSAEDEDTMYYEQSGRQAKLAAYRKYLKKSSLAKRRARKKQGLLSLLAGLGQGDAAATGLTDVGDVFGLQGTANSMGNFGYGLQDSIAGLLGGSGSIGALGGSPGGATGQGIGGGGGYGW